MHRQLESQRHRSRTGENDMTDEEIIAKIMANQWWPFDRVDPKILEEIQRMDKQKAVAEMEEAPL